MPRIRVRVVPIEVAFFGSLRYVTKDLKKKRGAHTVGGHKYGLEKLNMYESMAGVIWAVHPH